MKMSRTIEYSITLLNTAWRVAACADLNVTAGRCVGHSVSTHPTLLELGGMNLLSYQSLPFHLVTVEASPCLEVLLMFKCLSFNTAYAFNQPMKW